MSSFVNFPLSEIWFDKSSRDRKDLGDLTDLKISIQAIGIINPPVITKDGRLVAGERRVTCAKELGWTHITVQFKEDLSERQLKRLELDENIKRKELTWQEDALAFWRYHQLCVEDDPKWTKNETADALGVGWSIVYKKLDVAEALLSADQRVLEAPKFSTALGIVQRTTARRKDAELEALDQEIGHVERPPQEEIVVEEEDEEDHPFILSDFKVWSAAYSGPRFNLIHCDFPYGINADKHNQGAAPSFGGYGDSEENYWRLIGVLFEGMDRFVAPAAHLIFWFSMKYYTKTVQSLTAMGWTVNPHPLIWWRSDNSGILPDPRRMPRQVYETALLCSRGDRFLVRAKSNLIAASNTKEYHMSEKPKNMLRHFLEMVVDDTTSILDPTCGSGNALIVAHQLGASTVLGIEANEEFYEKAKENWKANTQGEEDGL